VEGFVQHVVLVVTALLFVASAVAAAVKRVRLPYTVALVITGAVLAASGRWLSGQGHLDPSLLEDVQLKPGVVLYVLLPILLYEAAFNLDSRRLLKNLFPITVLAVPAVIISTAVVGLILYFFGEVPHARTLTAALLFGAMVSTTDAVAVVAIFREIGAPKRLNTLVEGEALFNSGTALVVFIIVASILLAPPGVEQSAGGLIWQAISSFGLMALGGLAVGVGVGFVVAQIISRVEEDALIEITLCTVSAFGSFLLGGYLGVSDVMAVIGAGLTVGNYGRTKFSPAVLVPLEHYWHYLAFVANSIIFLLVGFSLRAQGLLDYAVPIVVAIVAILIARAVGIYPLIALVNRFLPEPIDVRYQTIMWWGGIRGALVLVMALGLSSFDAQVLANLGGSTASEGWLQWLEFKSYVLHLAFGIVFFTILVNAASIKPWVNVLGLAGYTPSERFEATSSRLLAKRNARERLLQLRRAGVIAADDYALLVDRYVLSEGLLRKELSDLRAGEDAFGAEDERRALLRHGLGGEKAYLRELYERGDIREDVMKDLHIMLENQRDRLGQGLEADEAELAALGGARFSDRLLTTLARVLGSSRLAARARGRKTERLFQAARARLSAIEQACVDLEEIERAQGVSKASFDAVRAFYEGQRAGIREQIKSLSETFAEYAAEAQQALTERYCLHHEEETLRRLGERGRVSEKVADDALREVRSEIRKLRTRARPQSLVRPAELVRRISFFSDLGDAEVDEVARLLVPIAFVATEIVVEQGQPADGMYLVARGSVEVVVSEEGQERTLATLEAGDFFGEIGLLSSQPRTATVRAREACALLKLRRRDLKSLTREHPHVREVLKNAYRGRVLSTVLARVPLFRGLEAEDRDLISEAMRSRSFRRGKVVQRRGDLAQELIVVIEGQLEVDRPQSPPRTLSEGESHGAVALCLPRLAEARLVAATDAEALCLAHLDFLHLLDRHPELRAKLAARVETQFGTPLPQSSSVVEPAREG
jgi:Na+:H+ antiporter